MNGGFFIFREQFENLKKRSNFYRPKNLETMETAINDLNRLSLDDLNTLFVTDVTTLLHLSELEKFDCTEIGNLQQEITKIHEVIVEKRSVTIPQLNQLYRNIV